MPNSAAQANNNQGLPRRIPRQVSQAGQTGRAEAAAPQSAEQTSAFKPKVTHQTDSFGAISPQAMVEIVYSHIRSGQPCSLLVVNISGTKYANDNLPGGHQAGDGLLQRGADVIRDAALGVRLSDLVIARSGPNFVVLIPATVDRGRGPEKVDVNDASSRLGRAVEARMASSVEFKVAKQKGKQRLTKGQVGKDIVRVGQITYESSLSGSPAKKVRSVIGLGTNETIFYLNRPEIAAARQGRNYSIGPLQAASLLEFAVDARIAGYQQIQAELNASGVLAPEGEFVEEQSGLRNKEQLMKDLRAVQARGHSVRFAFFDGNAMGSYRSVGRSLIGETMMDAIVQLQYARAFAKAQAELAGEPGVSSIKLYRHGPGSEEFYIQADDSDVSKQTWEKFQRVFQKKLNSEPLEISVRPEWLKPGVRQALRISPLETGFVKVNIQELVRRTFSGAEYRGLTITMGTGTIDPAMDLERAMKKIMELGEVAKDLNLKRRNVTVEVRFEGKRAIGTIIPLSANEANPKPIRGQAETDLVLQAARHGWKIEYDAKKGKARNVRVIDGGGRVLFKGNLLGEAIRGRWPVEVTAGPQGTVRLRIVKPNGRTHNVLFSKPVSAGLPVAGTLPTGKPLTQAEVAQKYGVEPELAGQIVSRSAEVRADLTAARDQALSKLEGRKMNPVRRAKLRARIIKQWQAADAGVEKAVVDIHLGKPSLAGFAKAHGPMLAIILGVDIAMAMHSNGNAQDAAKAGMSALGGYFTFLAAESRLSKVAGHVSRNAGPYAGALLGMVMAARANYGALNSGDASASSAALADIVREGVAGFLAVKAGAAVATQFAETPVWAAGAGFAAGSLTYVGIEYLSEGLGIKPWIERNVTEGSLVSAGKELDLLLRVADDETDTPYFTRQDRLASVDGRRVTYSRAQETLGLLQAAARYRKMSVAERRAFAQKDPGLAKKLGRLLLTIGQIGEMEVSGYADLDAQAFEKVSEAVAQYRADLKLNRDTNAGYHRFTVRVQRKTKPIKHPITGKVVGYHNEYVIEVSGRLISTGLGAGGVAQTYPARTYTFDGLEGDVNDIREAALLMQAEDPTKKGTYRMPARQVARQNSITASQVFFKFPQAREELTVRLEGMGYQIRGENEQGNFLYAYVDAAQKEGTKFRSRPKLDLDEVQWVGSRPSFLPKPEKPPVDSPIIRRAMEAQPENRVIYDSDIVMTEDGLRRLSGGEAPADDGPLTIFPNNS